MTSCSGAKDDIDNIQENIGVNFVDYIGKDIPPIPDNVIELLAESPCWKVEKLRYAKIIEGTFYITETPKNPYIGVSFADSIYEIDKDGLTKCYYYGMIKWVEILQPCYSIMKKKISKANILYFDGEEMIFTPYSLQDGETEVALFFTKVGSQEMLDKWIEQISE